MKNLVRTAVFVVCFCAASSDLWARVNLLEPWAPGFDTSISEKKWNNSMHVGVGNGGAGGTDSTELGYALTTPFGKHWEVAGALGFKTLDSGGAWDDSGLTDLSFAAKRRLPEAFVPNNVKAVGEFGLSLPTGDPHHGLGAGGLGFFGNAGMTLPVGDVRGFAELGLKVYTEGNGTRWGDILNYRVGGMCSLYSEWMVSADLRVISHGKDKIDGVSVPDAVQEAYIAPGGVWRPSHSDLEAQGVILLGLTGDAYDFGFQFGLRY